MAVSLKKAQEMLEKYLDAEGQLLEGKTIQWGNRLISRESLEFIRSGRQEWERKVSMLSKGSRPSVARFI
jgi:hypothetical protein